MNKTETRSENIRIENVVWFDFRFSLLYLFISFSFLSSHVTHLWRFPFLWKPSAFSLPSFTLYHLPCSGRCPSHQMSPVTPRPPLSSTARTESPRDPVAPLSLYSSPFDLRLEPIWAVITGSTKIRALDRARSSSTEGKPQILTCSEAAP